MTYTKSAANSTYRHALPQLSERLFLTDGGLETTLIFHDGFDLPYFAAFDLLKTEQGQRTLQAYFRRYAEIAARDKMGLILETATWRASADWGDKLGYSAAALSEANRKAVTLISEVREKFDSLGTPVVISGCVGPRGDGYNPTSRMSAEEAEAYHQTQIKTFAKTDADLVTAVTMTYTEEAVGIVRAAQGADMPVVISFTTEMDGRLPSGETLEEAIATVDVVTDAAPRYYMVNCAHPEHFQEVLCGDWTGRVRGVRANASRLSHAELDEAETLDDGDPHELANQYRDLKRELPNLNIMGGCCGTDHRHIAQMGAVCGALFR